MAEHHDDFDRNRERGWDRDRSWDRDRGREGYRSENYPRQTRETGSYADPYGGYQNQGSDFERRRGDFNQDLSEFGQGGRDDWRSRNRGFQDRQSYQGGMGNFSGPQRNESYTDDSPLRGRRQTWQRGDEHTNYGAGYTGTFTGSPYDRSWDRNDYDANAYGTGATGQNLYGSRLPQGQFVGRGPKGYQRGDERIKEDVCERLTQHPDIDASEVEIQVHNGEVTLTGAVEDRHQKRTAEDIIENLSGVREVHNQLRVSKGLGQRVGEALGLSGGTETERKTTTRQSELTGQRR